MPWLWQATDRPCGFASTESPRPRKDAPVSFELPAIATAADKVAASSSLLKAVAAGEVTPDEAGRVMALLTAHKALVETGVLESRIVAVEAKK